MNISDLTVRVRLLVNGKGVAMWRVQLLALGARLLGVPLDTDIGVTRQSPVVYGFSATNPREVIRVIQRMAARQNPHRYTAINVS